MLLQIDLLNSPTFLTLLFITFVKLNNALKNCVTFVYRNLKSKNTNEKRQKCSSGSGGKNNRNVVVVLVVVEGK